MVPAPTIQCIRCTNDVLVSESYRYAQSEKPVCSPCYYRRVIESFRTGLAISRQYYMNTIKKINDTQNDNPHSITSLPRTDHMLFCYQHTNSCAVMLDALNQSIYHESIVKKRLSMTYDIILIDMTCIDVINDSNELIDTVTSINKYNESKQNTHDYIDYTVQLYTVYIQDIFIIGTDQPICIHEYTGEPHQTYNTPHTHQFNKLYNLITDKSSRADLLQYCTVQLINQFVSQQSTTTKYNYVLLSDNGNSISSQLMIATAKGRGYALSYTVQPADIYTVNVHNTRHIDVVYIKPMRDILDKNVGTYKSILSNDRTKLVNGTNNTNINDKLTNNNKINSTNISQLTTDFISLLTNRNESSAWNIIRTVEKLALPYTYKQLQSSAIPSCTLCTRPYSIQQKQHTQQINNQPVKQHVQLYPRSNMCYACSYIFQQISDDSMPSYLLTSTTSNNTATVSNVTDT